MDFHADGESFGISLDYASYLKFFAAKLSVPEGVEVWSSDVLQQLLSLNQIFFGASFTVMNTMRRRNSPQWDLGQISLLAELSYPWEH